MYENWQRDPASVNASWHAFFSTEDFSTPPQLGQTTQDAQLQEILKLLRSGGAPGVSGDSQLAAIQAQESVNLFRLCRAYMAYGHLLASLDPLELKKHYHDSPSMKFKFNFPTDHILSLLDYKKYGFTEADLEKTFKFKVPFGGSISQKTDVWKLKDLIQAYKNTYASNVGLEFMHITDRKKRDWIRQKFESLQYNPLTKDEKLKLFGRITRTHSFADFMAQKFNTMKRFGIEGVEAFIPGLKSCMDKCTENGARTFIIGMPHRGRLNCLADVVKKPKDIIFAEFAGAVPSYGAGKMGEGDVKYHLGTTLHRTYGANKVPIKITLMANPSHLEAVNPVVLGRARAEQHFVKNNNRDEVVPILIHGDASFAGQGICYETLQMQDLPDYTVGGTIHVVANNQVGFTTSPFQGRSGYYCTDLAKTIHAPIFHVNADCLEDVARVFEIAAEYRQEFNTDVFIDVVGYRLMGHNELDNPFFT